MEDDKYILVTVQHFHTAFCRIFATVYAMEDNYKLKKGISIELSNQYIIKQIARKDRLIGVDISKAGVYLSGVFKCLVEHGTPLKNYFEYYDMPPMEGYIPIPEFEKMYKIDRYQEVSYPDEQFIMSKLAEQPLVTFEVDARTWKYWSNEDMVYCPHELTYSYYLWSHELHP